MIPIRVEGDLVGGSNGEQALRVGGDSAGVGGVELKRCAGSQGLRQRDGGFVELAGVIGIGVEDSDGEGYVPGLAPGEDETDPLPVQS